jgi:predicted exporter
MARQRNCSKRAGGSGDDIALLVSVAMTLLTFALVVFA